MSDADKVPDELVEANSSDNTGASTDVAKKKGKKKKDADRKGIFARMALFFRQVVAELRKVIWPTRNELINWTWIVLVFVVMMALFIGLLDFVFLKVVLWIFG